MWTYFYFSSLTLSLSKSEESERVVGKKCNYFINDKDSLLQILLPIFNFTKLNSSKYFQFILFEKVVNFIKDKKTFIKRR